jgi:hypothetical protein
MAKIAKRLSFAPHDPNKLWQILPQKGVYNEGIERIKGFRYPSPGSAQMITRVPVRETEDETYNIQHYTRDMRNWPINSETGYNASSGPVTVDLNVARSKDGGSRPDGNPAVLRYDETGLRSARSASWDSFDQVIGAHADRLNKVGYSHVPLPVHHNSLETDNETRATTGVPPLMGRRWKLSETTDNFNKVRW